MATVGGQVLAEVPPWRGRLRHVLDSERWLGRFMLTPAILYIAALVGFPFFLALFYSFSDVTVGSPAANVVGLKN
ncbi:MAG: hypothetical protein ACE5MI_14575, partial [Acidimicrobiia bacterium]